MPRIIDYEQVLATLTARGMKSLYHNSGSFGFSSESIACGWIGADDPTIRDSVRAMCTQVPEPHAENLVRLFERAWMTHLRGAVWIMPGSHWAYELDFGSDAWLPDALRTIQIDPASLQSRNNASAIAFEQEDSFAAEQFVWRLLTQLGSSDFAAAFPSYAVLCTIHHHSQLWWQTPDRSLHVALSQLPSATA